MIIFGDYFGDWKSGGVAAKRRGLRRVREMSRPVPFSGLIRWDGAAVKEGLELDSATVTQLDSDCEVTVVEVATLRGRERLRLEAPVEGWVSAMFVSAVDDDISPTNAQRDKPRKPHEPAPRAFTTIHA